MTSETMSGTPWYLHFWPWFIVVLLGVSVIGSLATVYVAYRYRDQEIARSAPAESERTAIGVERSAPAGPAATDARDSGR